jgi:hypothetical protein
MTEPFTTDAVPRSVRASWSNRPVALERIRISQWYARFYAPLAIAATVLPAVPLYTRTATADGPAARVSYGAVVTAFLRYGDGFAAIALILVGALVALLVAACVRVRTASTPFAIAGIACVLLALLLAEVVFTTPHSSLSPAGAAALVLCLWTLVLGLVHGVHLRLASSA